MKMIVTNNVDFYNYLTNKGVLCTYFTKAPTPDWKDAMCIIFTNQYHSLSVCGNRFNDEKTADFISEASELLDWFDVSDQVVMISNVNKFGTPYMRDNFESLQRRYDKHGITKQVIHTKNIGELINPHRIQIRYKGLKPIEFDLIYRPTIKEYHYGWFDDTGHYKSQQIHYINVICATSNTETRRKLRYIPEYTLYSQLYKKLCTPTKK